MKTIRDILLLSTEYLAKRGISSPRRQAEELLSIILGVSRLDLYMRFDYPLIEEELVQLRAALRRRGEREPLQYIQGKIDFYHCTIAVDRRVLIPRQETEILVDFVINQLKKEDLTGKELWDICCGSGCIGIAIKKAFPQLKVTLSDISKEALEVAQANASANAVAVDFVQGNLLLPFQQRKTDFLLCNPPYISEEEFQHLEPEVKEFEPPSALVAMNGGYDFYVRLAQDLDQHIYPGGKVWLEMGHLQALHLQQIFDQPHWSTKKTFKDFAAIDRFFFLEKQDGDS